MSDVTLIADLQSSVEESKTIIIDRDQESLSELIVDLSLPIETRIQGIEMYFANFGQEESNEIINRLSMMYTMSGTKILEKYLYAMCMKCKISTFLKITAAKSLCYFNPEKELGYKALDTVCKDMEDVATPCQIEAVCLLMLHTTYKKQSLQYFCNIINNLKLDCDYRYKTILSLENKEIPARVYFIKESALLFFKNQNNRTLYRILAGQYLIQKTKIKGKELEQTELTLMSFAQDPDLDYNLRADAADVVIQLGSEENKKTAREIIMMLGRQDGDVKTIFDNAQNVHVDEIEQSVLEALEFLSGISMKTLSGVPGTAQITFEYVKKQIEEELEKSKPKEPKRKTKKYKDEKKNYDEKEDKIKISLNRIYMDRALYSNYNCSLLHILLKIWTYLSTHKSYEDMKNRLLEELIDMSGTCSSGFASRLVNVISGYGDFNLTISWRDQIVANFTGRLNARARDIASEEHIQKNGKLYNFRECNYIGCDVENDDHRSDDAQHKKKLLNMLEKFQENVLEEMTVNSNEFAARKNFLKFFRKNMLGIRQELYEEFKEHIPDTDFDLYFRAAIATYETGGYV
jgi:hypothetical protein